MTNIKVASFYRFISISNLNNIQQRLLILCKDLNLLGTILLAEEGFNGSLSGTEDSILEVFQWLEEELSLTKKIHYSVRWGNVTQPPFNKIRVKIKREIVALGREDIRPYEKSGKSVSPEDWNKLIRNPETLIIDTRNKYLSHAERLIAPLFFEQLNKIKNSINNVGSIELTKNQAFLELSNSFEVEYLEVLDANNLKQITTNTAEIIIISAVRLGETRLIDNIVFRRSNV